MPGADQLVRGDIVTVADGTGPFTRKPRPAIVLQSVALFGETVHVPVCPVTSTAIATPMGVPLEAPLLRIPVAADASTGLQVASWAAIDMLHTVRFGRIGPRIGSVDAAILQAIDRALMVFLGIAGQSERG